MHKTHPKNVVTYATTLIAAFAILNSTGSLNADILISNFDGTNTSGTAFGTGTSTITKAAGFTLSPDRNYIFDSVELELDFQGSVGTGVFALWSGDGQPLNFETFLETPTQSGSGSFEFTASSVIIGANGFVLEAEETYWVVVSTPTGSDQFLWNGSTVLPTGLATNAGYLFNGAPSGVANKYSVNVSAVPEPSSLGLVGLGLLFMARRRKRI